LYITLIIASNFNNKTAYIRAIKLPQSRSHR